MDHKWRDVVDGEDQSFLCVRAEKPNKESVEVHVNMTWSYDPAMVAQKCDRCGMMSFNSQPEKDDSCDVHIVRQIMES